jgi:signal peptidase II
VTKRNLAVLAAVTALALAIDQVSKLLVLRALVAEGRSVKVMGNFLVFALSFNRHGVFGLPISGGLSYLIFPVLGILLIILFARSSQHVGFTISYGLILGGAFGNLIDRLFRPQGVVDFISMQFVHFRVGDTWLGMDRWFTYNVADSCLVVGVILLLIFEFFSAKSRPQVSAASEAARPPGREE